MGTLSAFALSSLARIPCPSCGDETLKLRAYVDGEVLVMLGESAGDVRWLYDGEDFVDGIFEVRCARCDVERFTSSDCPRCGADDALADILDEESAFEAPDRCPVCDEMELRFTGFYPVEVLYRGQRPMRTRNHTDIFDPGFHGARWRCEICEESEAARGCPLCGSAEG